MTDFFGILTLVSRVQNLALPFGDGQGTEHTDDRRRCHRTQGSTAGDSWVSKGRGSPEGRTKRETGKPQRGLWESRSAECKARCGRAIQQASLTDSRSLSKSQRTALLTRHSFKPNWTSFKKIVHFCHFALMNSIHYHPHTGRDQLQAYSCSLRRAERTNGREQADTAVTGTSKSEHNQYF